MASENRGRGQAEGLNRATQGSPAVLTSLREAKSTQTSPGDSEGLWCTGRNTRIDTQK